eukprot:5979172-Amphidinium_carterae.1
MTAQRYKSKALPDHPLDAELIATDRFGSLLVVEIVSSRSAANMGTEVRQIRSRCELVLARNSPPRVTDICTPDCIVYRQNTGVPYIASGSYRHSNKDVSAVQTKGALKAASREALQMITRPEQLLPNAPMAGLSQGGLISEVEATTLGTFLEGEIDDATAPDFTAILAKLDRMLQKKR